MPRRLRFECAACGASFVDWLDDDDELTSAFCVNCGQRVAHAVQYGAAPYGTRASEATSALGLVRGSGHEFPETLRGLRPPRAPSFLASDVAPPRPQLAPASDRPFARADSTAPRPASEPAASLSAAPARFWQRPRFAQLGALVIGFALGVPLTCLVEHAYFRARHAATTNGVDLTRQLAQVSAALDDGNLTGARSLLEQSARFAGVGDRRLSVLRARLAFESADAEWIRRQAQSKLGAALDAAPQAFADLAFQALEATKQERAAAPRDPALWALAVDGLRIYGDHERAAWLARGLPTSDAEANYAMGTLGMATQEHTPSAFLPFLRAAAESSNARARARAGLTLGLILSHHAAEAERELLAVQSLARPHPALAELRRLYDAEFAARPATLAAAARPSPVATSAPPLSKVEASPQAQLARARELQRMSRLTEAEHLYESILRARPNDSEARTGLAEVELLRGSVPEAQALYERALSTNENYVPAWVALADIDWQRGQLERAVCRYQLVVSRFPEGTYPPYINQRILRVMGSGAVPPTARTDVPAASACGD